ncbi:hypothetical protein BST61_g7533 [Cercospora zeina]
MYADATQLPIFNLSRLAISIRVVSPRRDIGSMGDFIITTCGVRIGNPVWAAKGKHSCARDRIVLQKGYRKDTVSSKFASKSLGSEKWVQWQVGGNAGSFLL